MFLLLIMNVGNGEEMLQTNEAETHHSPIRTLLAKDFTIIAPKSHLCAWSCSSYARKQWCSQALTWSLATCVSLAKDARTLLSNLSIPDSLWFLWFGVSVIVCASSIRFIMEHLIRCAFFNKVHHGHFWL